MRKKLDMPEISLREAIRMLRFWLAKENIPDADKVRIELHFQDRRSKAYAVMSFLRETDALTMQYAFPQGVAQDRPTIEGIKVIFSDSTRYDVRPE